MQIEGKDGKVSGTAQALKKVPKPTNLRTCEVKGELLHFAVNVNNQVRFTFEGKLPAAGARKIFGSMGRGTQMIPAVLEATTAKNQFDMDREFVLTQFDRPAPSASLVELIRNGKAEKLPPEGRSRNWVEAVLRLPRSMGHAGSTTMSLRCSTALVSRLSRTGRHHRPQDRSRPRSEGARHERVRSC